VSEWVSEWLLFNAKWEINFSPISWRDEMMMMLLCTRPTPNWIFIVLLTHWNKSLWIDMSLHSSTLSWFWANQSLFIKRRSNKYQFYCHWLDLGLESRSTTLEASMLTGEATHINLLGLWCDLIVFRTHELLHSKREDWPLHHRYSHTIMKFVSSSCYQVICYKL
jgi:hypothetical protein